ncbi:MAG: hypothetical protein R3D25_03470 [Geminicoccaceae bacterium]
MTVELEGRHGRDRRAVLRPTSVAGPASTSPSASPIWRRSSASSCLDLGIHVLDIARFFMGEVIDICARTQATMAITKADPRRPFRSATRRARSPRRVCSYTTRIDPGSFPADLRRDRGQRGRPHLLHDYRLSCTAGWVDVTKATKVLAWL